MKKVLVTGAGGQLGKCLLKMSKNVDGLEMHFFDSKQLDINSADALEHLFGLHGYTACINCAAYTKVELAEEEKALAFKVNADAVKKLAEICDRHEAALIHFSTDYVFNGKKETPYAEGDKTEPLNVYGASKLAGENFITTAMKKFFILRTSWLYSDAGHNFFNTILQKAKAGTDLKITTGEKGTPTNAYDLAQFVIYLITEGREDYGIYHFSNLGEITWYDFAAEILRLSKNETKVSLEKTAFFKTKAQRPQYSVLDKTKLRTTFNYEIRSWDESLATFFPR